MITISRYQVYSLIILRIMLSCRTIIPININTGIIAPKIKITDRQIRKGSETDRGDGGK